MLGRTMQPPAKADQWVLRHGKDDYPACPEAQDIRNVSLECRQIHSTLR